MLKKQFYGLLLASTVILLLSLNPPAFISWLLFIPFLIALIYITSPVWSEWWNPWTQRIVNKIFRYEKINGLDNLPYLDRWTLLSLPGRRCFYLHRFVGSDWRDLHDHPKDFWSIGIKGGYVEQTPEEIRRWVAPWIRKFEPDHIHRLRINRKCDTWTLIFTGPTSKEWGFYPAGKWIRWDRYLKVKKNLGDIMTVAEAVRLNFIDEAWLKPRKHNGISTE